MPRGDRTGPWGQGPLTGRGMGFCAGQPEPGYFRMGRGFGRGRGFGPGWGRGFGPGRGRRWFGAYAPNPPAYSMTRDQEIDFLENETQSLEQELSQMKRQLDELKSKTKESE